MNVSPSALLRWERGCSPPVSSYPSIIAFLGREPWGQPRSFREHLIAARRRLGFTIEGAARHLGVDPSTYWRWENGRQPHRLSDRARCRDFIGDDEQPLRDETAHRRAVSDEAAGFPLGTALRDRRRERGLTQRAAAAAIGASEWTFMSWEANRRTPGDRFYPALIRFLGREPWPEPGTPAERLRAEHLRRGLTQAQLAAVLQVYKGSIAAWERGNGPHHEIAKLKLEAFLTGAERPWRRRRENSGPGQGVQAEQRP